MLKAFATVYRNTRHYRQIFNRANQKAQIFNWNSKKSKEHPMKIDPKSAQKITLQLFFDPKSAQKTILPFFFYLLIPQEIRILNFNFKILIVV